MRLQGLHHITMITGDAPKNVEFYAETLGLRLVKKTVNFDAPEAYHLYFSDEQGSPGSILTWFEFAGAMRGQAGAGMIHTIELGVGSDAALDFWARRLSEHGYTSERGGHALQFSDYDGLQFELGATANGNPPLRAAHPEIPPHYAIQGVERARAYSPSAEVEQSLLTETLGFTYSGSGQYHLDGEQRQFSLAYDEAPTQHGRLGAGTVHHIAWASRDEDHLAWQASVRRAGAHVTNVRDREYFKSIYFREPSGVLFEIATLSPGFAVDEDPEHLGEELRLPSLHEHRRSQLERSLTPLANPRVTRRQLVGG